MPEENGPTQSVAAVRHVEAPTTKPVECTTQAGGLDSPVAAATPAKEPKKKRNRTGEWKLECDLELLKPDGRPLHPDFGQWEDKWEAVALSTEIRSLEQAKARVRKIEEDRTDGIRRRYRVIVEKAILEPKVQTKQVCLFE